MPTTESKLLNKQAVEEIEARANAATEGDWTSRGASWTDGGVKLAGYGIRFVESSETYSGWDARTNFPPETPEGRQASADRSFLAHAREDIPALCRTVKHLWAERDAARSDLEDRTTEREMWRGRYDEELKEHSETQSQLEQLRAENERLTKQLADIEEREAALCPEDVGFAEYIRTLETKLERLSK